MRPPLVVIPQHFGSLVFDRRTSRYTPFDHDATALFVRTLDESAWSLRDHRAFVETFARAGYFTPSGYLAGVTLDATPPRDHLLGPLAVHVEVIAACQLACGHCFAGELPRKTTLSTTELDRVFGELAALGSFRLGLTGGEPLLRKDLFDVIDAATAHGLHPCLTTNGLLIDEHVARELGKRELVWINISLDGASADTNDRIRGTGVFDEVVRRIRAFGHLMRFTLAFTITRDSAREVTAFAALARELGASTAVFRPVYPTGNARHRTDLAPSFADYTAALARLTGDVHTIDPLAFSPATRFETQAVTYRGPGCGAANTVASISSTGDVNPCSFLGDALASVNVRERSFAEIWNAGQAFVRLREHRDGDTFRGGCRARSLAAHGDVYARDPWHDEWLARHDADAHPLTNHHVRCYLPVLP